MYGDQRKENEELTQDSIAQLNQLLCQLADELNPDVDELLRVSDAINVLSGSKPVSVNRKQFYQDLNDKYHLGLVVPRKRVTKKAVALVLSAAVLVSVSTAQAMATSNGQSLYEYLCEGFRNLTYTAATMAPDNFADEEDFSEPEVTTYNDLDSAEAKKAFDQSILRMGYLPDGFTKQSSKGSSVMGENMFFERYSKEDEYLVFTAEKAGGEGVLSINFQGKIIEKDKRVGNFSVTLVDNKDSTLAVFESGKMLYQVESNLPLEEIETVIKNLKEDAE